MVPSNQPERETCAADSCSGVRLTAGNRCWAHADDQDARAALKELGEDGDLDARGVPITAQLLQRLLRAAPTDRQGRPSLNSAFQPGKPLQTRSASTGWSSKDRLV
jgi:hypothetical protein